MFNQRPVIVPQIRQQKRCVAVLDAQTQKSVRVRPERTDSETDAVVFRYSFPPRSFNRSIGHVGRGHGLLCDAVQRVAQKISEQTLPLLQPQQDRQINRCLAHAVPEGLHKTVARGTGNPLAEFVVGSVRHLRTPVHYAERMETIGKHFIDTLVERNLETLKERFPRRRLNWWHGVAMLEQNAFFASVHPDRQGCGYTREYA